MAALRRRGLSVEVLALGDPAGAPEGVQLQVRPRAGMARRALRAVQLPWQARGRVLLTLDPDVVPAAVAAARLRHRVLVADVHEDYVALLADRAWARRARRLQQPLAARCVALAGRAELTVVADDHVPPAAAQCRARLVVPNLPDPALLPAPAPVPDEPPLRAVYVGDVRTSRGLREMVEAVAAAPPWELDVVGPVAAADQDWLWQRLAVGDLAGAAGPRIRVHGRRPPVTAWRLAAGASVGMLLLADTPAFRAAVPTKLYEYLAAGIAPLATPLPRVVALLSAAGTGAVVPDADAAGKQLRAWAEDPAALAAARRAAAAWATANLRTSPWDGPP